MLATHWLFAGERWKLPSYPSLKQKHGDFHAESFPLPNVQSPLFGSERALFVDNGLGQ